MSAKISSRDPARYRSLSAPSSSESARIEDERTLTAHRAHRCIVSPLRHRMRNPPKNRFPPAFHCRDSVNHKKGRHETPLLDWIANVQVQCHNYSTVSTGMGVAASHQAFVRKRIGATASYGLPDRGDTVVPRLSNHEGLDEVITMRGTRKEALRREKEQLTMRRPLVAWTIVACSLLLSPPSAQASGPDRLANGSFEEPGNDANTPSGWSRQAYAPGSSLAWESAAAHPGFFSVRVTNPTPNDAAWTQAVTLEPNRNYLLSGWIKTENVAHTTQLVDAGANLSLCGTWQRTAAVTGTNDWTYVRLVFNSGPAGTVTICARLGYSAGVASGTAWFDDLRLSEIMATDPHPRWKILVLIYDGTDVKYTDAAGEHHVIGEIGSAQVATAAANAARFVQTDIPALSSGNMLPELTIRYPGTLRSLSPLGNAWWPSSADTAAERDPAFDSVIVIWQPTVTDQATGQLLWIGNAAGLTPPTGTAQTYTTLIIEAATLYGHLNVFKHEWGHSLLFYYEATGRAPTPTVTNHAVVNQYVHCTTAEAYVWLDETDANPIENSIYHNTSGFTHDYYSGTTALATDPVRCLGITPAAWATGGPVSMPNELDELIASHSQKCLDVTGWSTQEGNPIIQWQCHGGDNQAWSIEPVAEGYSRLVSRYSGQCLDVSGESTKDGAPIIQWACHGGANQQWRLETIGEGYRFVARHSGMCLDVTGGATDDGIGISQWQCHGGANQTWLVRLR